MYLAGVCVGLHVGLLLLILWDLEVEVGVGVGGEVDGVGGGELGELDLLLVALLAALLRVAECVLQQHFLNRLPHLNKVIF